MQASQQRKLGRTDLMVSAFALGTAPVGNLFQAITDDESDAMFRTAWEAGVRYYDTAPMYGHGLAELRSGHALRWRPRDDYVLSSKVGRRLTPARRSDIDFGLWVDAGPFTMAFDYSYDGTMRAFEDSLQRLGNERIDICFIHDIDVYTRGAEQPEVFRTAMDGCWKALEKLRSEGVVKAIGVGVNEWEVCLQALQQRDFDCFLLAGRYTLLEQHALDQFLPLCQQRDVAVLVGGGFNSGILATGARPGARYNYAPAPAHIMQRVAAIEQVCAEYAVPLPAAALQFVMAHPAVASFIAGTHSVQQLQQNLAWFSHPISPEFWRELQRRNLLREDAPIPLQ